MSISARRDIQVKTILNVQPRIQQELEHVASRVNSPESLNKYMSSSPQPFMESRHVYPENFQE